MGQLFQRRDQKTSVDQKQLKELKQATRRRASEEGLLPSDHSTAAHKGEERGRMGGSDFFQPKKKKNLKSKAVQERSGEKRGLPSLEEVAK